jgi:hypothetical protein
MSQPGRAKRVYNSKGGLVAALIILGIVALILAIVTVRGLMGPGEPGLKPGAESAAPSPSKTPSSDGKCEAKADLSTSLTPELPSDLEWAAGNGETWPVSPSYGPTTQKDGFGICFSRSPLGAALAAASMMMAPYNGHTLNEVLEEYAADSPGKEAALTDPGRTAQPLNGNYPIVGFRINSYVDDRAEVVTVVRAANSPTGYAGNVVQLAWNGDDWKMVVRDSGQAEPVTSPAEGEFTPWRKDG